MYNSNQVFYKGKYLLFKFFNYYYIKYIKSLLLYDVVENNSLEKKRKKLTSNSIGSMYKFNKQKPKTPKKDNSIY